MRARPYLATLGALAAATTFASSAAAEPTEPLVIGWWSYFDNAKISTTTSAAHPVTSYGDPDTYYYEPSGGHGMQEDPAVLPPDQAWNNMVSYVLAQSNSASLSPSFSISTTSDLNALTQAYYGFALVLLYVPKDKYCDSYQVHIGSVDDGVQAMVNGKIVGYSFLGEQNKLIDMVEYGSNPPNLVLRPGINEVVLIHEDQAAVERYVTNVWIEHNGVQVDLAPKDTAWGQVQDATTLGPLYQATVGLSGNGVSDAFVTGPLGFYFFAGLADGTYDLTADAVGYQTKTGSVAVALGQGATEVVRTDLLMDLGCSCPDGTECGPSGGCLLPCVLSGEIGETCADPQAVCVNHLCVTNPCDTLTCAPGFLCQPQGDQGSCVEVACSNVCCAVGEVCSAGLCVPDNCVGGCPAGETCAGGNCVDSCTVITCVDNLVCVEGECLSPCVADPSGCGVGGGFGFGGGGGSATSTTAGVGGAGATDSSSTSVFQNEGDAGGCGCDVPGRSGSSWGLLAVLGGLGVAARQRRKSRAALAVTGAFLAAFAMGCTDDATESEDFVVATSIAVDPADFLGGVACGSAPGAMQTYVATITDTTDPLENFTLPSSPPTPCSQTTTFRYVIPGHVYTAEIDGYDTGLGGELEPYGGSASGARRMLVKTSDGSEVIASPRWTTACGTRAAGAATAVELSQVPVQGCDPMTVSGEASATAIVVDPSAALGGLACEADGGTISAFSVSPDDPALPAFVGVACGAEPVVYDIGIAPLATYSFRVSTSLVTGKDPQTGADLVTTLSSNCYATAKEGLTIATTCTSLSASGALSASLDELLALSGLSCDGDVATFEAQVSFLQGASTALLSGPVKCGGSAQFAPLDPGAYSVKLVARDGVGSVVLSGSCLGVVAAGETTSALSCQLLP